MRAVVAAFGIGVLAAVAAGGETGPSADALVKQLGDPRFAEREAAAKALVKAGPAAADALRSAISASPDPDVRDRAERVLEQIGRSADSARLTATKTIKPDYKGVTLAAVVEDVKKKTGIPLLLLPDRVAEPARLVTFVGPEMTAWEAVEALCAAAGLREEYRAELPVPDAAGRTAQYRSPRVYYGESPQPVLTPSAAPVLLADGKHEPAPGSRAGGVRVLVMPGRFPGNRIVRGTGRVVVNVDAAPLPHLNWQEAAAVRVTRAEDEDGRSLFADMKVVSELNLDTYSPWGMWGGRVFLGGGNVIWLDDTGNYRPQTKVTANPRLAEVALRTDDRAIKMLKRFEGVVTGEIAVPNVPVVTVENLKTAVGKEYTGPGQSKLAVAGYTDNPDGSVTVRVRAEAVQPWVLQQMAGVRLRGLRDASDNIGNVANALQFFDSAGKRLPAPSQGSSSFTGDGFRQTFETDLRFPKGTAANPPARLVQVGTKSVAVEVPFAALDVRLP